MPPLPSKALLEEECAGLFWQGPAGQILQKIKPSVGAPDLVELPREGTAGPTAQSPEEVGSHEHPKGGRMVAGSHNPQDNGSHAPEATYVLQG